MDLIHKFCRDRFCNSMSDFLSFSIKNMVDSTKGQKLHDACISGDIAAVRKLLDDGVDVNWKNGNGRTPLMKASGYGQVEVAQLLIDRGAQINIQNNGGGTALMNASFFGKIDCARLLLERGADMSINIQNNDGVTALMSACYHNHGNCARLLLERGADMSIKDDLGKTAKDWAVEEGHTDIVQLLDEHETKKNSTSQTQAVTVTEVVLPQAQVLGELVLEPFNKALQEENGRLKTEIEVLKERELSKNKEMLLKQELMDEYKARSKSVEEENQRSKDENQKLMDEVSCLKEKEIAMRVENEYLKRRDEEMRAERNADRAMLQSMMSSLINGAEDRIRMRNDDEETK